MNHTLLMKGFPKLGNVYRFYDQDYIVSVICGSYRFGVRSYLFPLNITKQDYLNGLRLYTINSSDDYSFVTRKKIFNKVKCECTRNLKYFIDCGGLYAILNEKPIEGNITKFTCIMIDKHHIRMFSAIRDVRCKKVIRKIELVKKDLECNINYIIEKGYHRDNDLMSLTLDELIEDYFIYCKNINSNSKKAYIYKYEIYKRLIEQL